MKLSLGSRVNSRLFTSLQRLLKSRGYELVREGQLPPDYDPATVELFEKVKPYTLTSHERVSALRQSVLYVVAADIRGAIVECGVWRGGSMLAIAHTLVEVGVVDRDLYLFDTFESMPAPGAEDVDVWGTPASANFEAALAHPGYAYLPQEEIHQMLKATGYPDERVHFVKGMVEDTIPAQAPEKIALCRLDTDWYESTAHEMEHLYPRMTPGGVVLVDDYGHYMGAKRAVDEYLEAHGLSVLLNRIDFTGRLIVIPGA